MRWRNSLLWSFCFQPYLYAYLCLVIQPCWIRFSSLTSQGFQQVHQIDMNYFCVQSPAWLSVYWTSLVNLQWTQLKSPQALFHPFLVNASSRNQKVFYAIKWDQVQARPLYWDLKWFQWAISSAIEIRYCSCLHHFQSRSKAYDYCSEDRVLLPHKNVQFQISTVKNVLICLFEKSFQQSF